MLRLRLDLEFQLCVFSMTVMLAVVVCSDRYGLLGVVGGGGGAAAAAFAISFADCCCRCRQCRLRLLAGFPKP